MYYIGLISGTSMDAIDTALIEINNNKTELVKYKQFPIPDDLRLAVREITADSSIDNISKLDFSLGHLFADAAEKIVEHSNITLQDITAIGSHGQTVLHFPKGEYPRTLQIGNANIIAYRTGVATVADFRYMDMAASGQGAPLASSFHNYYFRSSDTNRVVLNIGGIANITVLACNPEKNVIGFDTGPGNGLLDDWNKRHRGTDMDLDGQWAHSGQVQKNYVSELLTEDYFRLDPPKSTGRDYFNLDWLQQKLDSVGSGQKPEDIQACLLQLTAQTITDAITRYAPDTQEVIVCGGGIHNTILMKTIRELLPNCDILSTVELGLDPDCVEAVTFAWLSKCRLEGIPGNITTVTGAIRPAVLGAVYNPVER